MTDDVTNPLPATAGDLPRRVVVRGGRVHVTPDDVVEGDLVAGGGSIGYVGPAAPEPEGALVLDARGASVVPLLVQSALDQLHDDRGRWDLATGRPATFAVIRGRVDPYRIRHVLAVPPADVLLVAVRGRVVVREGRPTRPAGGEPDPLGRRAAWTDPGKALVQHLRDDGRYSETRGTRRDAYTGDYWLDEDRITYLDDSGFWAFGQWVGDTLHHAGFVMTRLAR